MHPMLLLEIAPLYFKEELHLKPKVSLLCVLSQNHQHWFKKIRDSGKKKCLRNSEVVKFQ